MKTSESSCRNPATAYTQHIWEIPENIYKKYLCVSRDARMRTIEHTD